MGCWNKTCALTQMPIFAGEETVMFFIVERPFNDGVEPMPSYSSSAWSMIPVPFYGEYDDYGFLDLHPDQEHKLQSLKETFGSMVVFHKGENIVDDWDIDKNIFDNYDLVKEAIHRNRLKLNIFGEKESVVSFVMFEKKSFDELIKNNYQSIHEILKEATPFIKNKLNAALTEGNSAFISNASEAVSEFYVQKGYKRYEDKTELFALSFWFDGHSGEAIGWVTSHYLSGFLHDLAFKTDFTYDSKEMAETFCINHAMMNLRKTWHPQGYEGSQSEINSNHDSFLDAYKIRLEHIKHRWDEDEVHADL